MSYKSLVEHYESCYSKHGDSLLGVDWPKEEDAYKRYQVMLDVVKYDSFNDVGEGSSVLDFGCGLAHLYQYIMDKEMSLSYTGLDLSDTFIKACQMKYPHIRFLCMDVLQPDRGGVRLEEFDYIIANGVFTEKQQMSFAQMLDYFKKMIRCLYDHCNHGIAFNVMSKDVDWEDETLFYLPLNELGAFLTKEVTRDFIVRNDYGLYEYTVYVYKR